MKEQIKQCALEAGFDLVGIAPATGLPDFEFARQWQRKGLGGEMRYLANPKRFDPRAVLPSVRSVICVGLIYNTDHPYSTEVGAEGARSQESEVRGKATGRDERAEASRVSSFDFRISKGTTWISRYAWGRDYHEVLRERLDKLRAAVEALAPRVETRVFVDTGPVIERAFARYSGIGWMGKNTCILNEQKGSWFFLGVILTNLALEPDLPAPDRCGSCTACLDACPTGALTEPYRMDASRCISYLTIELKGPIPVGFRAAMGNNVFGCDICQDVCPWNSRKPLVVRDRFSEHGRQKSEVRSQERDFQPLQLKMKADAAVAAPLPNPKSQIQNPPGIFSLFNPPLESLAAMTEEDFRRAFRHSPIKRTKYRGWLRNLCVAMGNSGDPRFLPWLEQLARGDDAMLCEHAEWALARLRPL